MNLKWDERFWSLAHFVSQWSKDPRAKVGAVISSKRGGATALGYNGFPAGVEDSAERLENSKEKLEMVIHAEQNALLIAGRTAAGGEMFVRGKPICSRCAVLIIQAGISRVIAIDPESTSKESDWYQTGVRAVAMLKEAGVKVDFMSPDAPTGAQQGAPADPLASASLRQMGG